MIITILYFYLWYPNESVIKHLYGIVIFKITSYLAKKYIFLKFPFLNPFPSSKTFLRKIYISAWKTCGGLELISENSLSPMSIPHTSASLLVGNTWSLNSEDAPSETQRTCVWTLVSKCSLKHMLRTHIVDTSPRHRGSEALTSWM